MRSHKRQAAAYAAGLCLLAATACGEGDPATVGTRGAQAEVAAGPKPGVALDPETVTALDMLPDGAAWALDGGRLLLSEDVGSTWHEVVGAGGAPILDAAMVDKEHGLTVSLGVDGLRLRAVAPHGDGAESTVKWDPSSIGDTEVALASASTMFVAVRKATSAAWNFGSLLRTTDGGATWKTLELPLFGELSFFDEEHGILLDQCAIFRTDDGGTSWTEVAIPWSKSQCDFAFAGTPALGGDGSAAVATTSVTKRSSVGGEAATAMTDDHGASWDLVTMPDAQPLTGVYSGGGSFYAVTAPSGDGTLVRRSEADAARSFATAGLVPHPRAAVTLAMDADGAGLALTAWVSCPKETATDAECRSDYRLYRTRTSGERWERIG